MYSKTHLLLMRWQLPNMILQAHNELRFGDEY